MPQTHPTITFYNIDKAPACAPGYEHRWERTGFVLSVVFSRCKTCYTNVWKLLD